MAWCCAEPALIAPPPLSVHSLNTDDHIQIPRDEIIAQARVVAAGDIMLHNSVKTSAHRAADTHGNNGYDALFDGLRPMVQNADLAFANMEFPVAPVHGRGTGSMVFNGPVAALDAIADAGFDVVSFANNHSFDQGRAGHIETIEQLEASRLDFVGAGHNCEEAQSPKIFEVNGIRIAIIAGSRFYNTYIDDGPDNPCNFYILGTQEILSRISQARQMADFVIVSIHWGVEYKHDPLIWDKNLAHIIVEAGADVLLGHHVHVLQPVEIVDTKDGRTAAIIYSMGNVISGQGYHYRHGRHPLGVGATRDGVLFGFTVRQIQRGDATLTTLADVYAEPIWTWRQPHPANAANIRTVINTVMVDELLARAQNEPDAAKRQALIEQADMLMVRRRQAGAIVGQQWLPPWQPLSP